MSKKLCKSKKSRDDKKRGAAFPCDGMHMCRKCHRAANSKKKLCKPGKLFVIE